MQQRARSTSVAGASVCAERARACACLRPLKLAAFDGAAQADPADALHERGQVAVIGCALRTIVVAPAPRSRHAAASAGPGRRAPPSATGDSP
jgi:hypothetical protein